MPQLTQDQTRVIIDDFAQEINARKIQGAKPAKTVINFRNDQITGKERDIWYVPIELLRYRRDNGRIASDVLSYEKENLKTLDEKTEEAQAILKQFLMDKDKEMTEVLTNAIRNERQREPAIITVDGFLINGNRRKMVLEELCPENPDEFSRMKVVILPGIGEEGGPPTIKEIEFIENRYQLQQDGRSEYKGLDRALSISRKMELGITLEQQLKDDPSIAGLPIDSREFKNKVEEYRKKYLLPLERVNAYLDSIERPGCYDFIGDRWQAFIDYSNFYNVTLRKPGWLERAGLSIDDIGRIEDIAFKIIRKKTINGSNTKLHMIMRTLPKLLAVPDAWNSLTDITKKVKDLDDNDSNEDLSYYQKEAVWGQKNDTIFSRSIRRAYDCLAEKKENENALNLLRAAYGKMTHENMNIESIPFGDLQLFINEANDLLEVIKEKKSEAFNRIKAKPNHGN